MYTAVDVLYFQHFLFSSVMTFLVAFLIYLFIYSQLLLILIYLITKNKKVEAMQRSVNLVCSQSCYVNKLRKKLKAIKILILYYNQCLSPITLYLSKKFNKVTNLARKVCKHEFQAISEMSDTLEIHTDVVFGTSIKNLSFFLRSYTYIYYKDY